jgi:dTDP-4-amino-4,6-dideoxygalactose transaminase
LSQANIRTSTEAPDRKHVYHIFSVFEEQRDALRAALQDAEIQTGIHYPIPVHQQKPFKQHGSEQELPNTEAVARSQLSLPMFPELTGEMVERVSEAVRNWYSRH